MFDDTVGCQDLDAPAALAHAVGCRRTADRAEAELLAVAAHWADLHAVLPGRTADATALSGLCGTEAMVPLAGEGTPEVAEFAPAELGAALGMTSYAGQRLVGDALELRHRLPRLWARVHDHTAPRPLQVWRARRIAEHTTCLSPAAAAWVDQQVAGIAHKIGLTRVMALVAAAMLRFDPEQATRRAAAAADKRGVWLDRGASEGTRGIRIETDALDAAAFDATVARLAEILAEQGDTDPLQIRRAKAIGFLADPTTAAALLNNEHAGEQAGEHTPATQNRTGRGAKVVLYLHLHESALTGAAGQVGRVEGYGPVIAEKIAQWVARTTDTDHADQAPVQVHVTPVRDLADTHSVDAYETPDPIREVVLLRTPCCPFPWCDNTTRTKDLDHINPYNTGEDRPQGQTAAHNLTGLCRRHHRLKTHGGWSYAMPEPGIHVWRSPTGRRYLVDHTGTTPLLDTG